MNALKYWFVDENNKAACRYMIVDAYNTDSTIHYYLKNGFKPLYKSEQSEKEAFGISEDDVLRKPCHVFRLEDEMQIKNFHISPHLIVGVKIKLYLCSNVRTLTSC